MRRIPSVMATQHPDNASAPYWEKDGDGFVSAQEEVAEAYSAFSDLGVDEFMWDWEGKYVDEAVIERFFSEYYSYFSKHRLGRDQFLTFRIPNIWQEKGYSLARAFMAILTAADMAHDLKLYERPLFEVILPMTESAQQLIHLQTVFSELAKVKHKLFPDTHPGFTHIEIIPLVESVEQMFTVRKLVEQYDRLHRRKFRKPLPYIRPFLARSDPALVAGLIPAVVGNKVALSELYQWSRVSGVPIYPISGSGALPFRGACSPENVTHFIDQYRGVRTVTIQSAFRYDYPLKQVKQAIATLQRELPKTQPQLYSKRDVQVLRGITKQAEQHYASAVTSIAKDIFAFSDVVPRRRERRLHIGLLGYNRTIGRKAFPRAITFTAALYSLGVPPELIGTGRTLRSLSKSEGEILHLVYPHLEHDIIQAGHFLNKENLVALAKRHKAWREIKSDIEFVEQYLGTELGPKTGDQHLHRNATSDLFYLWRQKKPLTDVMLRAGKLRKSLG